MNNGTEPTKRTTHATAILGPELQSKLPTTKVLLVGAGGIGCELLKNVVLAGFGRITLLDLDTIDLSNLNRQFLFRKKDVKQSKALIAARAAGEFNPNVTIEPIHGNVKEERFDAAWFGGFDIVLNALDNLDARRHVNKMCMAANVPLVESGTAGYLGQVQPIIKDLTECFECVPKQTPKTFPVCTIRSTPSQPIHCIVWSKSYLMGQLFGQDEEEQTNSELDDALNAGENPAEIDALRREASAFRVVRDALRNSSNGRDGVDAAQMVFDKVFDADVRNLLSMKDMWKSRSPPTPLNYEEIVNGMFNLKVPSATVADTNGTSGSKAVERQLNGGSSSGKGLKDQRTLSLKDNLELFLSSTKRLAARLANEPIITFDKDDDDTLDFVTATANLRSAAYGIGGKTRWEVKEMAGNIIPAIATTNAIVSGLIVLQALQILRHRSTLMSLQAEARASSSSSATIQTLKNSVPGLKNVHTQMKPSMPLPAISLSPPNPACGTCRDTYLILPCDPERATLSDIVGHVTGGERDVSVYEDKRLLMDPDWDDNADRTLASLGVRRGMFLTIEDEDGELATLMLAIVNLPDDHVEDGLAFILPSPMPALPSKTKVPPPAKVSTPPPATSSKRPAPSDDTEREPRAAKRVKIANSSADGGNASSSPSTRRKLEEDGLVLMEDGPKGLEEEDDVIIID